MSRSTKDYIAKVNSARQSGGLLLAGAGRAGAFKGNNTKKDRQNWKNQLRKGFD